ncbi:MAG: hypothetical protein ACOC22_03300 [bacterium]
MELISFDELDMVIRISYYSAGVYYTIFNKNAKKYGIFDRILLIGAWILDLLLTEYL